ncbi:branched-chain amino acid transport system ATP-binding protein [Kaistia soli DSM 19436]|uniref:Branched-chain amino acid transport system ATP-binding protein n=1 Tax=Kaistia soli DSM 19436 TaxID=1122133 RepID=A0A1M4WZA1_9HYPH|nr:ABC transporter ATP-binding protein [Kaistia soli]SHE86569.1 branched-chain amino acid transport system ATP-binding protein [Kaistia soli DSM 19436]
MLEVQSVSKSFDGFRAVDDVSFAVPAGAIVGLIGPNGAGKTTTFNLIAGTLQPTAGAIRLGGRAIEHEPAHRRVAAGLARTFQIPKPFGEMSVLENVLVAARAQPGERMLANLFARASVRRQEQANIARAREIVAFVDLAKVERLPAKALSGGQRKLLELARVLMAEPRLILLDEPAAGVNPALLEIIMARIEAINRTGITFLIIEHNMDLVARLCGEVIVMAEGRVLGRGAPEVMARDPRVVDAYLGGAVA